LLRRQKAYKITSLARASGLDTNVFAVEYHYLRFLSWYNAEIDTDYLCLVTGTRRLPEKRLK